jgi:hypothetical protein
VLACVDMGQTLNRAGFRVMIGQFPPSSSSKLGATITPHTASSKFIYAQPKNTVGRTPCN